MREDVELKAGPSRKMNRAADNPPFDYLVERYYRPLYQFAFSLTHSEADAADLTQHTFLTWQTKGQQLRDLSKVRCWLFTTLHRAFLQTRRRETRFPHFQLDQVDSELPSISDEDINRLDAADALGALRQLDEVFRTPLTLFYIEDCPYKEIAQTLNVPLGTVKSRIARGIAQLKALLTRFDRFQEAAA
jgi:RNA polymerase sigma factor (sigma-70 family)